MELCEICNKPLKQGQAFYGSSGNHYDCEENKRQKAKREFLSVKKELLKEIADKHAPNRSYGISETQIYDTAEEYANLILRIHKI
jgi:hypothetical protein